MRNSDCWYISVCDNGDCDTCIRYKEMSYLMENSNIPKNRCCPVKLRPSNVDRDAFYRLADIKDDIVNFVNSGSDIYITSKFTGNGKTTWAIKLMLKYFDSIWPGNGFKTRGIFLHIPTFLLQLKNFSVKDEKLERIKEILPTVDLVIWDDIASTDISAYDYSQLLMYIDMRVSNGMSNIFTGNLTDRESLQKALGDKLTSRIWSSYTEVVEFKGGDRR